MSSGETEVIDSPPDPSSTDDQDSDQIMFHSDPCGWICMFITYAAVIYSDFVVLRWICLINFADSLWLPIHATLFNIVVISLVWAHLRAVFSDPGIIPLPATRIDFSEYYQAMKEKLQEGGGEDDIDDWTVCGRCEVYRPPRAHHCRVCRRCVRRMDHHCPWVNNCVGQWNQKYFIQFLFYVGVLCIYAAALVLYSWTTSACGSSCKDLSFMDKQSKVLHTVVLMLECIIFGMFVLAILIDQLTAIFTDLTAVEQVVKRSRGGQGGIPHIPRKRKSKLALLGEVCGRGPIVYWLFPCHNNASHQQQKLQQEVGPISPNDYFNV